MSSIQSIITTNTQPMIHNPVATGEVALGQAFAAIIESGDGAAQQAFPSAEAILNGDLLLAPDRAVALAEDTASEPEANLPTMDVVMPPSMVLSIAHFVPDPSTGPTVAIYTGAQGDSLVVRTDMPVADTTASIIADKDMLLLAAKPDQAPAGIPGKPALPVMDAGASPGVEPILPTEIPLLGKVAQPNVAQTLTSAPQLQKAGTALAGAAQDEAGDAIEIAAKTPPTSLIPSLLPLGPATDHVVRGTPQMAGVIAEEQVRNTLSLLATDVLVQKPTIPAATAFAQPLQGTTAQQPIAARPLSTDGIAAPFVSSDERLTSPDAMAVTETSASALTEPAMTSVQAWRAPSRDPEGSIPLQLLPMVNSADFGVAGAPALSDGSGGLNTAESATDMSLVADPGMDFLQQMTGARVDQPVRMADTNVPLASLPRVLSEAFKSGNDQTAVLQLDPVELGSVAFNMDMGPTGLTVVIAAERPETLELMRRHADQFLADLRQSGVPAASLQFQHSGQSGQDQTPHGRAQQAFGETGRAFAQAQPEQFAPSPARANSRGLDLRL